MSTIPRRSAYFASSSHRASWIRGSLPSGESDVCSTAGGGALGRGAAGEVFKHEPTTCKGCLLGGAKKRPFKPNLHKDKYTHFGQKVSSDLCGPFPTSRPQGFQYAVVFYDWATGHAAVYFLKSKGSQGVRAAMLQYLSEHKEWMHEGKVGTWHTDNGSEFMSPDLDDFCAELSIRRSFSIPYAPPTNAAAERVWGILLRGMRIMTAHMSTESEAAMFWPFLMNQMCQIHNSLPSARSPVPDRREARDEGEVGLLRQVPPTERPSSWH